MSKLKFGLSQVNKNAPKWVQNGTAIVALLIAAKHYLIGGIPNIDPELKELATGWFEYVMNSVQIGFAVALIFMGVDKNDKPDTDYPNKP